MAEALESVEVTEPLQKQTNPCGSSGSGRGTGSRWNAVTFLRKNAFVLLTMMAVALGLSLGFALRHVTMTTRQVKYLSFPGELLMRVLQLLLLPLIVSSLITGMSSVDRRAFGRVGLRAFVYYLITTLLAAFTGISLCLLIQPGNSSTRTAAPPSGKPQAVHTVDAFLDMLRNVVPVNVVEACFRKYKTVYSRQEWTRPADADHSNVTVPMPGTADGLNVLGILAFSVAFGLILGSMEDEGKPLRDFFDCLNKATMRLVNMAIWYSPAGILFLLVGQIVQMSDPGQIGRGVGMYVLSVVIGLAIHSFITLPLIFFIVKRENPFRFMAGLLQVLTTAFGTSSSSATLPVTLHCLEENHGMDKQVTRFMLPVGATMNMDGAALYEAVAALFIAQVNDVEFGLGQVIVLSLIVTAASTGAAGIPQAGMVFMVLVLTAVGLPAEDVSLLMIADWILDRLRTVTNVLGDCIGVGVVQHLSTREL